MPIIDPSIIASSKVSSISNAAILSANAAKISNNSNFHSYSNGTTCNSSLNCPPGTSPSVTNMSTNIQIPSIHIPFTNLHTPSFTLGHANYSSYDCNPY